tara:strand:+ start:2666 stop:2893 length:228 start_codon:yes stop_codon:yes gene_type:complete
MECVSDVFFNSFQIHASVPDLQEMEVKSEQDRFSQLLLKHEDAQECSKMAIEEKISEISAVQGNLLQSEQKLVYL